MRTPFPLVALAGVTVGLAACGGSTPSPSAAAHAGNTTTSTTAAFAAGPYGPPQGPGAGGGTATTSGVGAPPGGSTTTTGAPRTIVTSPPTTAARATTTTTQARTTTTTAPTTTTTGHGAVTDTSSSGGLTVSLTADPASTGTGAPVRFTIKATESRAPGALLYQLTYGDGGSAQNTAPTTCRGGTPGPAQNTWTDAHPYASRGTFFARVVVRANCTSDQTSVTVTVTVT